MPVCFDYHDLISNEVRLQLSDFQCDELSNVILYGSKKRMDTTTTSSCQSSSSLLSSILTSSSGIFDDLGPNISQVTVLINDIEFRATSININKLKVYSLIVFECLTCTCCIKTCISNTTCILWSFLNYLVCEDLCKSTVAVLYCKVTLFIGKSQFY